MVADTESRDQLSNKDARLINCYAELNRKTGNYAVEKRPGSITYDDGHTGSGFGIYRWVNDLYAIWGDGTITKNGANLAVGLNTVGGYYRFVQTQGIPRLVFGNGLAAYYTDGATVTQISDPDFPNVFVRGWAYLDGTLYVMRPDGGIQGSGIDDPTTWDPLNLIFAEQESDDGVALAKQNNFVVALKQWTTEFFYDAKNPTGSPLAPYTSYYLNFGIANEGSLAEGDGILLWASSNRSGSIHIVKLENLAFEIVSTPDIDRLLENKTAFEMRSVFLKIAGHRFYVLDVVTLPFTLVYDLDQKKWYEWTDSDPASTTGGQWPFVSIAQDALGTHVGQHTSNGAIYALAPDYIYPVDYGDNVSGQIVGGFSPQVDIYTPNFDFGVNRNKMLNAFYFLTDVVKGSVLQVRHSDDDYTTWSGFRPVSFAEKRPFVRDEGTFFRRAYNFRHVKPTKFRISDTDLQMDLCTL